MTVQGHASAILGIQCIVYIKGGGLQNFNLQISLLQSHASAPMDITDEQFGVLCSNPDALALEPSLLDARLPLDCDPANVYLPLCAEQPQDLLVHSHFSPLPFVEQFTVPTSTLQYGNPHAPTMTGTVDFSVPPRPRPRSGQSQWHRMSTTSAPGNHTFVPPNQLQNTYQNQYSPLCGWSREYEPHPAPPPTSLPSVSQSLSSLSTHPYSGVEQQYDAYTWHVLGGSNAEAHTFSPNGDNGLSPMSPSGFLAAFADYDFSVDAGATDHHLRSSIGPVVHNAMLPVHSATMLPSSLSTPNHDSADRHASRKFECQWTSPDGVRCQYTVVANRRSVIQHLHRAHGIKPGDEKARQKCQWERCETKLNKESLARHILTVHLKERVKCTECGESFAREDSLKRHLNLKGGHHHVPPCKPREGATTATRKRDSHHGSMLGCGNRDPDSDVVH